MPEYIEREALYRKVAELEMLARDRYLETPTNSPAYPRYMAQLGERTHLKFLIGDFPAADVAPVRHGRCEFCKDGTSFIGQRMFFGNDANWHIIKFCPHCGHRMDAENP